MIDAYTKFIEKAPEKIELKPFGLSQNVNRINSNFDGTTREYSKKPSSSEDKMSSLALENDLDESETWQQKYIVYNSSSGISDFGFVLFKSYLYFIVTEIFNQKVLFHFRLHL